MFIILAMITFFTIITHSDDGISKAALSASKKTGVPYRTLMSIAEVESSLNPDAIGKQGEIGAWQLHPKFFEIDEETTIEEQALIAANFLKQLEHSHRRLGPYYILCYNVGSRRCSSMERSKSLSRFRYYKRFKEVYDSGRY